MKKTLSVLFVLVMLLGLVQVGFAAEYPEYPSNLIPALGQNSTEMTSVSNRSFTSAVLLLDYMLASSDTDVLTTLSRTGSGRIAAYGSCVDVYYLRNDGKYFNLFVAPNSKEITNYGTSSGPYSGSQYTYYDVSMSDIFTDLTDLVNALSD